MNEWIIIDMDILIDAAYGLPEAVRTLDHLELNACPAISIITKMELLVGCRSKNELQTLDHFMNRFEVIALTPEIGETTTRLIQRYRLSHGLLPHRTMREFDPNWFFQLRSGCWWASYTLGVRQSAKKTRPPWKQMYQWE